MTKKILFAIAVVALALLLVACGGEPAVTPDTTVPEETEHVHAYNEEIVASTCTEAGYVKMVCQCGDVQSEEALGLIDHTPSVANCEADTVCTVCNTVLAPATGHTLSGTQITVAATCGTEGKEKSTCLSCGFVVETTIPATGHVPTSGISASGDGYAITCASCNQKITLKAQDPALKLTFDGDITSEIAGNSLGIQIVKPEKWSINEYNGSKALYVNGTATTVYMNVPSPKPLVDMGMFVISFDYMSTKEATDASRASVFSILGNFYNGAPLQTNNETKWGWALKLVEATDVLSTKNATDTDATNSVAIERNVVYKIDIVYNPNVTGAHVFVNGNYIGDGKQGFTLAKAEDGYVTLRFGDGPECGHVFDNFTISALK